jgi:hypothetical protein
LIGPIGGLCSPRPGRRLVIALSGGGRPPLGLRDSYLHAEPADDRPVRIMSRNVFHHPQAGLHFAGTVNQASGWGHVSAIRAMLRIIKAVRA